MALRFAITDLTGAQLAVVTDYAQALVTIPYNDSRTAELTLNPQSQAGLVLADQLQNHGGIALRLMLKAWYILPDHTPELVFWGPIVTPTWSLAAGGKTLKLEAHDMSIRLKHHYLSSDDAATIFSTDPGAVSVGYQGLRALRDAGKNTAAENTAGIPDLLIGDGTNTHPGPYAVTYTTADYVAGDSNLHVESTVGWPSTITDASQDVVEIDSTHSTNFTYTGAETWGFTGVAGAINIPKGSKVTWTVARSLNVAHGDEVWQRWTEIAGDPFGPDFRLRPDDSAGYYALLDTFDKRETEQGGARDKRYSVIFQAGFGTDNVTDFTYAPQGGSVRNRAIAQQSHTASDGTETAKTKVARNTPSRVKYGNYESWETIDSAAEESIKGAAEAVLLAYSEPPQNFTFSPRSDAMQRFFYGRDFVEGEVISCAAHFGGLRIWLPGFISEVRLRQISSIGQTKVEIDALPEIVNEQDITSG